MLEHSPATNSPLPRIQNSIQARYDLKVSYDVENFVCLDRDKIELITGKQEVRSEALIVHQLADELDITLFIDEELFNSISDMGSPPEWDSPEFDSYLVLMEGVSHFVYLVWNAEHGKCVKPVELELQSDVDKFVCAIVNSSAPHYQAKRSLCGVAHRLFNEFTFPQSLAPGEANRYLIANNAARQYCSWLARTYDFSRSNVLLYAELARFYRMSAADKFSHISKVTRAH